MTTRETGMKETEVEMPKMDCASEERLVRMALEGADGVRDLRFDLETHRVVVRHEGEPAAVLRKLEPLGFGARLVRSDAVTPTPLTETVVEMPKMDCASEERLVRMALEADAGVRGLRFDLESHQVVVRHTGDGAAVLGRLEPLGFGARVVRSEPVVDDGPAASSETPGEARVLKQLLAINAGMFVLELVLGWIAQSTGLMADSIDMFADAAVYGISLYAVGRAVERQKTAAFVSGVLQLLLAVGVLVEVVRRTLGGSEPVGALMMGVAALALVANLTCMALLSKHRTGGVHMRASWIFSTNDVLANLGVLLAGALVAALETPVPDLVIGTLVGLLVTSGAVRILRLARA